MKNNKKNGYIMLLVMVILSIVCLLVVMSLSSSSSMSLFSSNAYYERVRSEFLINSCADEAMIQIWNDTDFTGFSGISMPDGVCDYTVTNTGGENRLIITNATTSLGYSRGARISITSIKPQIRISFWEDYFGE